KQPAGDSYTAKLMAAGTRRIAQKVGEEGVEVALAATAGERDELLEETADLLYHLLVLLTDSDLRLSDAVAVLESRHNR
ncbi:MAG: phosphoribosyl-ATP diphosphatase, partial [Woeseia sp.]